MRKRVQYKLSDALFRLDFVFASLSCLQRALPQSEAVSTLIELISESKKERESSQEICFRALSGCERTIEFVRSLVSFGFVSIAIEKFRAANKAQVCSGERTSERVAARKLRLGLEPLCGLRALNPRERFGRIASDCAVASARIGSRAREHRCARARRRTALHSARSFVRVRLVSVRVASERASQLQIE